MAAPASKRQRTLPQKRFEADLLARFEAAGAAYSDVANEKDSGYDSVMAVINSEATEVDGNPPAFAPPALRIPGAGKDGSALVISQTANILAYIGPKIGLTPDDEGSQLHVAEIAMTALDINNEIHDTHHPLAVGKYYEDQKGAALERAADFRENRLPKYFSYFERLLKGNETQGKGKYVISSQLTYADTSIWQIVDGLYFAFPKEMKAREQDTPLLLGTFYPSLKEEPGIKDYLASDRRLKYSMGVFRYYTELDRQ